MSLLLIGDKDKILVDIDKPVMFDSDGIHLGIENVRELKKQITILPKAGETINFVIPAAEKLTPEAQNALLKTLEEPPENVKIILIAPNLDFFLPTIISRCEIKFFPRKIKEIDSKEVKKIFDLIETKNIASGFAWAKKLTDRKAAIEEIDNLLIYSHQNLDLEVAKKLFSAKKYLSANTNVRLTLENLFVN